MAILKMVSIRDSAVNAFMRPFAVPAIGAATRAFTDDVNNPQSESHKHPEDYELYHVGDWDEDSGTFRPIEVPELIVRGKDCIKSVN